MAQQAQPIQPSVQTQRPDGKALSLDDLLQSPIAYELSDFGGLDALPPLHAADAPNAPSAARPRRYQGPA